MDTPPKTCESCGSQLLPDVEFCAQCGAPVPEELPAQLVWAEATPGAALPTQENQPAPAATPPVYSYTPAAEPVQAYTPPPDPPDGPPAGSKSRLPCFIISGVLILGLICACILAVAGYLYFYPMYTSRTAVETEVVLEPLPPPTTQAPVEATPSELPTEQPAETPAETLPETQPPTEAPPQATPEIPAATAPSPDEPSVDDFSIFDPFNDNQLGWETDSASDLTTMVENGAYSMYTPEVSTYFWVYPPVVFDPIVLEFDVWVDASTSTEDLGTYGVVCNLVDSSNFTFLEIDPSDGTYYFARFDNDEETSLLDPEWNESNSLALGAGETNHVLVECYPDSISLYINDSFEASVDIDPPTSSGRSGFMIGTWETIDPNGYKVFFDNFYGYIPQQ